MRRLIGPESIAATAIKPLLILAVAIAAFFVAPAVASAEPAGGLTGAVSTVAPNLSGSSTIESKGKNSDVGVNAVYTCRYGSVPPFQVLQFTCTVRFGTIQVILNCVDGRQIFGPILQAVGTYNFNLSCAPTGFSTFNVQEFA
jgi:hypothetical protein